MGDPVLRTSLLSFKLIKSFIFLDRQVQLERGDTAAQELVNSLQVLEVMAGAMSAELKPLVKKQPFTTLIFNATSQSLR